MKIAIDAGHGPETAGKRTPDGSLREFQFNSVVSDYVAESLKSYENVEILKTHDKTRDVPLEERTDKANSWKSDVFVSIHANANGSTWNNANGIETFTYTSASAASNVLAASIQRNLVAATGLTNRGVKKDNLHVLRETTMPAVLVECGFMTNHQEADLLKSDTYRQKCANAIVKSLVDVYGLKKKEEPVKMPTNSQVPVVQRKVPLSINGGPNVDAYLINDTTYVPIRVIAEAFGATVDYNGGNPVKITK